MSLFELPFDKKRKFVLTQSQDEFEYRPNLPKRLLKVLFFDLLSIACRLCHPHQTYSLPNPCRCLLAIGGAFLRQAPLR